MKTILQVLPFMSLMLSALPSSTHALTFTVSQRSLNSRTGTAIPIVKQSTRNPNRHPATLHMRDASCSYWFTVGDQVRVTSTVTKAGFDLKGREGTVKNTWEKCEVDPTCCCAEFVDDNFAVTVQFEGTVDPSEEGQENGLGDDFIKGINCFTHFFNEDELIKVPEEEVEDAKRDVETTAAAFDGISCTAFKLDQLKMGKQAQRIAAYEASQSDSE
eukprot:CAMPEP_0197236646 /NCGR_PEP_ID=MMETSP1429-20130617/3691_1 /TAXON_ID=49237 /ORGANISM="Chaetoceros  sp., Strain UNC1202" /LENGTH=215 /DNA_ID=CAMNT_0042695477 /DNA_START=61 /DNA_END=708 /DNA_ORIENTATION=+